MEEETDEESEADEAYKIEVENAKKENEAMKRENASAGIDGLVPTPLVFAIGFRLLN